MFGFIQQKLLQWLSYEPPTTEIMPYDYGRLKHEIRPGDVLLFEGRSRISSFIRAITQSSWTHAALYIGKPSDFEDQRIRSIIQEHTKAKENTRIVIEGLLDKGTVLTPLSTYRHHHIRICRPIGLTPDDTYKVILYAIQQLGKSYSVRHLLDLARYLLPWTIMPRRWGSVLFRTSTGEPESGICSSMIAEAFESVQFPILPYLKPDEKESIELYHRNPHLFSPKDFDFSPYFAIIKYPLFSPHEPLPYYRRLPWAKSGMMYQDQGILTATKKSKKNIFQPHDKNPDDEEHNE